MISVAEAVSIVCHGFGPLGSEHIDLRSALGRVLAEDLASRVSQPPADVSAMDGYAVRSIDIPQVPSTLKLVGESAAGARFTGSIAEGETVRISTGAPVPSDADAIVIQENVRASEDSVAVLEKPLPGKWIRRAGLDFSYGQVLLKTGCKLTARHIGLAAAMNIPWLRVRRKPCVGFIATGNEVVLPGEPLGPDQIISSNSLALSAYIETFGGTPINLGIADDDDASLMAALESAGEMDLLVTVGGASVGDHDLVKKILRKKDFEIKFHKVAMRPGKPVFFGVGNGLPVLGLPGNPVSVGVAAVVFLKPALEAMLGAAQQETHLLTVSLGRDLPANDQRQDYLRAKLTRGADNTLIAEPFQRQDSSMLALFSQADCLVIRSPFAPPAYIGDNVKVLPLTIPLLSQHAPNSSI
jgi:molybdopterin molybdotransferase